jgi:hypothetical protein
MVQFGQGKAFKEYASLSKNPLTEKEIRALMSDDTVLQS